MDDREDKIKQLAQDVLQLSRNALTVNLRFMDRAISSLTPVCDEKQLSVAVDGRFIRYHPVYILRSRKQEKELVTRDYLHMILHCIFLHAFVKKEINRDFWNLACDIAVETVIQEMDLPCTAVRTDQAIAQEIQSLRTQVRYMTAEVLYRHLCEGHFSEDKIARLQELFVRDDHSIWYHPDFDQGAENKEERRDTGGKKEEKTKEQQEQSAQSVSPKEVKKLWKDISQKMQLDLETFSREQGEQAGTLTQNLMAVNREHYDYSSFLRKFAAPGEMLKINDEEFDYIFYTYGLSVYKKMPLVEPLEYKEVKKIKEFVIALDTSGSTSETLVQKFVQKTYNILKQQENFFTKINLHIIQCDAEIQEDVKITSQQEFDDYLDRMQIRGLAGTDFRPVFSYVEYLMGKGEFTNLKGMIYFTDGFGEFPKKQPPYKVAVIYLDEGYENPQVPVWAIRLVLNPEEI